MGRLTGANARLTLFIAGTEAPVVVTRANSPFTVRGRSGGFLPTTAFAIVAATGNIYYGLWYPVAIAALTAVVGVLLVKEGKDADIHD